VEKKNWQGEPNHCLCKCLAQTNPFTSKEWVERHWVARLTARGQRPRAFEVKSVRYKLGWLLPLFWVVMHGFYPDRERITCLESNPLYCNIAVKCLACSRGNRWFDSQSLLEALLQELELLGNVVSQILDNIKLGFIDSWHSLIQQALFYVWVLSNVHDEIRCGELDRFHSG